LLLGLALTTWAEAAPPNVLFIAVDDLRPQLGCYGLSMMHTPNIDRLAHGGIVFERAYCMVPTCGASRASLMTGIRPTPKRFVNYLASAEKEAPNITTLNTHFKENGYYTLSNGKVFHHLEDNAQGWSEPAWRPPGIMAYGIAANQELHDKRSKPTNNRKRGPSYEAAEVEDEAFADGKIAQKSLEDLRRLAKLDRPFFMAVGFYRPHLPFVAPKKYWDLYDADTIHLPETYHKPKNAPTASLHTSGELRAYSDIPAQGPVSNETALNLIRGYYACVSYTDAQIGKLLDELDRLGLAKNTIVVFWGDHGWNLGEHLLWCKHSCYETSMHAPLIVRAPGIAGGKHTPGLTEFIDIYPSLCELAGLTQPSHLQGRSFVELLKTPDLKWKSAAIGRFVKGDTIRTDRYRFSEYTDAKGQAVARMLYNHESDPGEDENISEHENSQEIVKELNRQLHAVRE
jgi:arylsulfatase A-like enzyme